MQLFKIIVYTLATLILASCSSDGTYYKTELFNGEYDEVAFELAYDVDFQEGGEKYANYKMAMLAMYDLYPSSSSLSYVLENTIYEDQKVNHADWTQRRIAKESFLKSAEAGFTPAMIKLAGIIDEQDKARFNDAYYWLKKASEMGNYEAYEILKSNSVDMENVSNPMLIGTSKDMAKAAGIDALFKNHDPLLAARRKREADQQVEEMLSVLGKVIVTVAVVALASELSDSNDSIDYKSSKSTGGRIDYSPYVEAAKKHGRAVSGNNVKNPYSGSTRIQPTQLAKPTYGESIKAASVQSPKMPSYGTQPDKARSNPFTFTRPPSNPYTETTTSQSKSLAKQESDNQCDSDYSCGIGEKCIKAPLATSGVCMSQVDQNGLQTFPTKTPNSVLPNLNLNPQCTFDTDCPTNFSCDKQLKVCKLIEYN